MRIHPLHNGVWQPADFLSIVGILLALLATASTVYLWRVFFIDRKRRRALDPPMGHSWLLLMLALACSALNGLAVWTGLLSVRRLAGAEQLTWAAPVNVVIVIVVELLPVYIASEFWRRRRFGHDPKPPFDESD